ncbi:MAG: hypothetical protein R3A50_05545 [Saprospiraceae bacterium]
MKPLISIEDVKMITGMVDPATRNYYITQSYHDLALAFGKFLGNEANWCCFATWASLQAGYTIRKEDLTLRLAEHLRTGTELASILETVVFEALENGKISNKHEVIRKVWEQIDINTSLEITSKFIGLGNLKVYAEIGEKFARFLETLDLDPIKQKQLLSEFYDSFLPGDLPNGQQLLKSAFQQYELALSENDAKKKAELVFFANIQIGLHEQTRLQSEIEGALNAGLGDKAELEKNIRKVLFPNAGWLEVIGAFFRALFNRPNPVEILISRFAQSLNEQTHLFLTNHLMEIKLPSQSTIKLAQDLKAPFPENLKVIQHKDLNNLLTIIDPSPNSTAMSGALDWTNLKERVHFITDFFRCYQETADLFQAPFGKVEMQRLFA